ncbi:hypothetical protein HMN09_00191700 [Mycena chlorophos]|uniref:Uncharacterized protein n=1 Tax=Mycena chlorophos TaxID=658473 RepID=A0A8H6WJM7_MYCCL|nr:hypothetical protein HMN09_00191700 [Mycena chlorophos]
MPAVSRVLAALALAATFVLATPIPQTPTMPPVANCAANVAVNEGKTVVNVLQSFATIQSYEKLYPDDYNTIILPAYQDCCTANQVDARKGFTDAVSETPQKLAPDPSQKEASTASLNAKPDSDKVEKSTPYKVEQSAQGNENKAGDEAKQTTGSDKKVDAEKSATVSSPDSTPGDLKLSSEHTVKTSANPGQQDASAMSLDLPLKPDSAADKAEQKAPASPNKVENTAENKSNKAESNATGTGNEAKQAASSDKKVDAEADKGASVSSPDNTPGKLNASTEHSAKTSTDPGQQDASAMPLNLPLKPEAAAKSDKVEGEAKEVPTTGSNKVESNATGTENKVDQPAQGKTVDAEAKSDPANTPQVSSNKLATVKLLSLPKQQQQTPAQNNSPTIFDAAANHNIGTPAPSNHGDYQVNTQGQSNGSPSGNLKAEANQDGQPSSFRNPTEAAVDPSSLTANLGNLLSKQPTSENNKAESGEDCACNELKQAQNGHL